MPPDALPPASPSASPPGGDPESALDLAALGAESETTRAVKRIVPWIVSAGLHLGLIVLGFLVTWTVVMLQRDREPLMIVADFNAVTYEPLRSMNLETPEAAELLVQDRAPTPEPEDLLDDRRAAELEVVTALGPPPDAALARFAPAPARRTASFVGLSTTNARRIVYVLDASGSMIRSLPIVVEELARSLDGLDDEQEFAVIFFSGNRAITVPPAARLNPGTAAEKARVLTWINEHVIPAGRSNPLAAIEKALSFRPDAIFLLSENITGSGEFEIDQADLLAFLEQLNPFDPDRGRRVTQINCVQFLDPDPFGTLEEIARRHGGPKGYKFLDREELGLKTR